jgi:hypothetical protein
MNRDNVPEKALWHTDKLLHFVLIVNQNKALSRRQKDGKQIR